MEQEDSTLLSEVKIEIDVAEDPSVNPQWASNHDFHGGEEQNVCHSSNNENADSFVKTRVKVETEVADGYSSVPAHRIWFKSEAEVDRANSATLTTNSQVNSDTLWEGDAKPFVGLSEDARDKTESEKAYASSDELEFEGVTVKFEVEEGTEHDTNQDEKDTRLYLEGQQLESRESFFSLAGPRPSTSAAGPHSGLNSEHHRKQFYNSNYDITAEGSKYLWEVCNKTFSQPSKVAEQSLTHSGEKPHVCDECNKTFTYLRNLNSHKLIHTGEKPHVCDVCNKAFSRASYLKQHKLVHTDQRPHVCDVCNMAFTLISHLKNHKLTHTCQEPHVCNVCGKAFTWANSLKQHQLIHTGQSPYSCDVCNKVFATANNLNQHKLSHTGQKPHVCDVCNVGFARPSDLKRHKLIHAGKKPHVCDVCNKGFTQSSALNRHKLTHTGQKPHVCDVCDKAFAVAVDLKYHKLTHTGEKPHVCDVCNKGFTRAHLLRHHKLSHTDHLPDATHQGSPSQTQTTS